jgi:hypothetical protein
LKYDVVRAQGTRVLDEMEEVQEVNCTSNSLSIAIIPGSDFDVVSRQFQLGNVITGGKEWGCQPGDLDVPAAAFTRRIESISIDNPPRIALITSDCSPFEAFERQDIDIWSEDNVHSGNDLRSHRSALTDPAGSEGNASTRFDVIDQDKRFDGSKLLKYEHFLLGETDGTSAGCKCGDYSKSSGSTIDPASVKACQDKGCTWTAESFYGGICSGTCAQASITGSVSLDFEASIQASFRFKLRATFGFTGFKIQEFESWIDETMASSVTVKARVNAFYSVKRTVKLAENVLLFAYPTNIAGVGVDFGFFGDLVLKMEANIEGDFSAEAGIKTERRKRYGALWDTSKPRCWGPVVWGKCVGVYQSGTMTPVNDNFDPVTEKTFTWGGKVVAILKPSLEMKTSFRLGVAFGSLGTFGFDLSAGLRLKVTATFKYGVGNMILQPVVTTPYKFKSNDLICQQQHQAEADLVADLQSLDVFLRFNPDVYNAILVPEKTLFTIPLFIGCWASGGFPEEDAASGAELACGPFSAIPNGAAFPDTGALSGHWAVVSCDYGYELTGEASFLCDRGTYQITTAPSCMRISCGLLSVENGQTNPQTEILFGDETEIQCNAGFAFYSHSQFGSLLETIGNPFGFGLVETISDFFWKQEMKARCRASGSSVYAFFTQ